jgi:hypothetical protein
VAVAVALVVRQWQLGSWRRLVAVGGEFPRRRLYVCGGVIFFRFFLPSAWQNETAAMGQSDKWTMGWVELRFFFLFFLFLRFFVVDAVEAAVDGCFAAVYWCWCSCWVSCCCYVSEFWTLGTAHPTQEKKEKKTSLGA